MPRKKWTPKTEITPSLLKFREKRKWQINLRRYVLEKSPCASYAPYFGLDTESIRNWFEYQFKGEMSWDSFAKTWQFDHIIPVIYFDFSLDEDLRLCWNFTNLRVEPIFQNEARGNGLDILGARAYYQTLLEKTGYGVCGAMLRKLEQIEISELEASTPMIDFVVQHRDYLSRIETYSVFEFEMLNSGRSKEEVLKEIDFLRNIGRKE
jgi:hypothetical protein